MRPSKLRVIDDQANRKCLGLRVDATSDTSRFARKAASWRAIAIVRLQPPTASDCLAAKDPPEDRSAQPRDSGPDDLNSPQQ